MASRALQSLLTSRHEWARPHQTVVRVGAAAAWLTAAVYLAVGAFTGDGTLFVEALGPILAASLMTTQIILSREDAGLALFASGLIVAVWFSVLGDGGTIVPASVSLVLISALGMMFVTSHRLVAASTLAGALFALPHLWEIPTDEQVVLGVIMALSFLITYLILGSIQTGMVALKERYQMLFEESPSALLDEDWSEAVAYVRTEYSGKPSRIRQFLLAYPTVVRRAVARARIVRANEAALSMLDISDPDRFLGYRDPDVVTDENLDTFVSALVCLYEGGRIWEREVPIRTRDGERRWLHYRAVDTSTGVPGSSVVTGLADITHMKARNEAMAEVVRTKDEFIANVSHELRTPLTAVIGLTSELADAEGLDGEMREEMLHLVSEQASEMSNIVEDLLVAARAEVGTVDIEIQEVALGEELRATLDGLGMSVDQPREVPLVLADPRRVRQILRNLLTNAQRYGGPKLRVVGGFSHHRAWLEVRDNGEGIPDEEAERIFEPYVTSGGKGSVGLGLAVARQLAELMGGTLQYERSAGESVFRLELPVRDRRDAVLASHSDAV
ncbi:MAG TPA: PAS domain-containing sensor histidine kinase [Acidimicrobiia bacterium]